MKCNCIWQFEINIDFYRVELAGGRVISGYSESFKILEQQLENRPALIDNRFGKGIAYLVTVYEFPPDEGMIRFTKDLLRTVMQGEQAGIRLMSTERIRYAVYEGQLPDTKNKYELIYLLNTDPDHSGQARIWVRGIFSQEFVVPANDLRLSYLCGNTLLVPRQKTVDLSVWKPGKKGDTFKFFNVADQKFDVFNLGEQMHQITINGTIVDCPAHGHASLTVKKATDPVRAGFYATDFLEEPEVNYPPLNSH